MSDGQNQPPLTMLVWGLLAAGLLELAGIAWALREGQPWGAADPSALLPISIAVLLSSKADRLAQWGVACAAGIGLVVRLCGLILLSEADSGPGYWLGGSAGVLFAAVLVGWSAWRLAHVPSPNRVAVKLPPAEIRVRPAAIPQSPATPIHPVLQARAGARWAKATTPWPRAQESDPNGTLIRPPRR